MRVGIDVTSLQPLTTGVDNYLRELVLALGRIDHDTLYTVFVNFEDRSLFRNKLPGNFTVSPGSLRPRPSRLLFQQLGLPAWALARRLDVVHSPCFVKPLVSGPQRHLLTIFDMTFFSLTHMHKRLHRTWAYQWAVRTSIRTADLIAVPSASVAQEIRRLLPQIPLSRVRIVGAGISDEYCPREAGEIGPTLARLGIRRPYVLHVGTIEPRKNLRRLVAAFALLVQRHGIDEELVLAGRWAWDHAPVLAAIDAAGVRDRVRILGYVDQKDLPALLSGARLFVYPSLQEGFGFPPLEAMACGVPTVSSDNSALAENLAGAAELVPPEDTDALSDGMLRMLRDDALRAQRKEQGRRCAERFQWDRTAELTRDCYEELRSGCRHRPLEYDRRERSTA